MESYIFKQLKFVRENTISQVANMDDQTSLLIPMGFNNNIKWNLGHIFFVQEKFPLSFIGENMILPNRFTKLFESGTNPNEWEEELLPTIDELIQLLQDQVIRIEKTLGLRMKESVQKPYTTSSGLTLSTVEEFLSFCLYHEGMHLDAIKSIKRIISK